MGMLSTENLLTYSAGYVGERGKAVHLVVWGHLYSWVPLCPATSRHHEPGGYVVRTDEHVNCHSCLRVYAAQCQALMGSPITAATVMAEMMEQALSIRGSGAGELWAVTDGDGLHELCGSSDGAYWARRDCADGDDREAGSYRIERVCPAQLIPGDTTQCLYPEDVEHEHEPIEPCDAVMVGNATRSADKARRAAAIATVVWEDLEPLEEGDRAGYVTNDGLWALQIRPKPTAADIEGWSVFGPDPAHHATGGSWLSVDLDKARDRASHMVVMYRANMDRIGKMPENEDDTEDVPGRIRAAVQVFTTGSRGLPPTHPLAGSNAQRQSIGNPGHCWVCAIVGHLLAHPERGCGDVKCDGEGVHADGDPRDTLPAAVLDAMRTGRMPTVEDWAPRGPIEKLWRSDPQHQPAEAPYAVGQDNSLWRRAGQGLWDLQLTVRVGPAVTVSWWEAWERSGGLMPLVPAWALAEVAEEVGEFSPGAREVVEHAAGRFGYRLGDFVR